MQREVKVIDDHVVVEIVTDDAGRVRATAHTKETVQQTIQAENVRNQTRLAQLQEMLELFPA
jgi:predicted RNA-binding protein (virulence factor B family)